MRKKNHESGNSHTRREREREKLSTANQKIYKAKEKQAIRKVTYIERQTEEEIKNSETEDTQTQTQRRTNTHRSESI